MKKTLLLILFINYCLLVKAQSADTFHVEKPPCTALNTGLSDSFVYWTMISRCGSYSTIEPLLGLQTRDKLISFKVLLTSNGKSYTMNNSGGIMSPSLCAMLNRAKPGDKIIIADMVVIRLGSIVKWFDEMIVVP